MTTPERLGPLDAVSCNAAKSYGAAQDNDIDRRSTIIVELMIKGLTGPAEGRG